MLRKIISVLLTAATILSLTVTAFAAGTAEAELYTIYGNGMLFEQNREAVFAGTAPAGSAITATLYDNNDEVVTSGTATAKSDNTFEVSFTAPEGAFAEYRVTVSCNGTVFRILTDVVFGELWIAGGQSNMQYPLVQSYVGSEMYKNGEKLSEWLRVLLVPSYPEYNGKEGPLPLDVQNDIPGAFWLDGQQPLIYNMSAVGYFFAAKLMEELDMPIGILNSNLGGSSIWSWLSREAIDADTQVKNDLLADERYISRDEWDENDQNVYADMTANYNQKIHPLRYFRPSGMIWYQGESDISRKAETYGRAMDLMQKSYADLFGFDGEFFPIIYTQLAAYYYDKNGGFVLPERNAYFSTMQQQKPESRGLVSIYDLSPHFFDGVGVIHPSHKKEIGERMADSAMGFIYGTSDTYTVATLKDVVIRDGAVYVSFRNVGDGLMAGGDILQGFAVCASDGVYIDANAEIVNADTVKIWSDAVKAPASASYAYCVPNFRANLYASANGELALPVTPFITDGSITEQHWVDKIWADCESDTLWHTQKNDRFSQFYDAWNSKNADIAFNADSAFSGTNGLSVTSSNKSFSVNPVFTYKAEETTDIFFDYDKNYSNYGTMSFYIRNNGNKAVTLDKVKIYTNRVTWFSPAASDSLDPSLVIPADGEWHLVTLDLDRLYIHGNEGCASFSNDVLKEVRDIKICFKADKDSSSDISIDHIRFTPSTEKIGMRFDARIINADNIFEVICAMFTSYISQFIALFK